MGKLCRGCGASKPTEDFYAHDGRPYGPCKSCRCAKAKARYQARSGELEHLRTIVAAIGAQVPYLGGDLA